MDDLQWDLKKLTRQHREGSIGTQTARYQSLDLIARQLKEMGYRNMRADSLKPKHAEAAYSTPFGHPFHRHPAT